MALARKWCRYCHEHGAATGGANHVLHLLLSLCTLGIWLPMWAMLAFFPAYRCNHCGGRIGLSVWWAWAFGLLFGGCVVWSILART